AARSPARVEDRGQPLKGRDPPALRQPDLPRTAGVRLCRGGPDLLQQGAQGPYAGGGRDARRLAESALLLQPREQPETCKNTPVVCTAANARPEIHQFGRVPRSTNRATRRPPGPSRSATHA